VRVEAVSIAECRRYFVEFLIYQFPIGFTHRTPTTWL
jgi:hypothetical protein